VTVQIKDSDGTVRLSGDLLTPGGATGDVLTQQADGTYAPAAGGSPTLAEVLAAGGDPDGNPVTGQVTVTPAAGEEALTITSPSADATKLLNLTGVHTGFTLDCDGTLRYTSDDSAFMQVSGTGGTSGVLTVTDGSTDHVTCRLSSSGGISTIAAGNKTTLFEAQNNAGSRVFRIKIDSVTILQNAAPADGDLSAGEMALWMDKTNGAAKFMVKAKQANGTVVTGSVNLA
jgi:VCBS repeat-containing protein